MKKSALNSPDPFDVQLERVKGKIRVIDLMNQFERRSKSLMYYWNSADDLRAAAIAVFEAKQLSKSVFCLLAGLSIELLLKGILLGLSDRFPTTHDLFALSQKAGISSSNDEKVLLHALTEYISWKSKYPTPKDEENWNRAENVLKQQRNTSGKLGAIYTPERSESLENYSSLWNKYANYFWRVHESVH